MKKHAATLLSLFSLCTPCLHAQNTDLAPSISPTLPAPVELEATASSYAAMAEDTLYQLTPAERNYLLTTMALFVDAIADDIEHNDSFAQDDSLIKPIENRLRATAATTDDLSEGQRAHLDAERRIQADTIAAMQGASDEVQLELYTQMKKQLRDLSLRATPEVQKLQQDSVAFAPLSRELRLEDRLSAIMAEAQASSPRRVDQEIYMATKLRSYANSIRDMRTPLKTIAMAKKTEQKLSVK